MVGLSLLSVGLVEFVGCLRELRSLLLIVQRGLLRLQLSLRGNFGDAFLSDFRFLGKFRIAFVLQSLIKTRQIKRIRARHGVHKEPHFKLALLIAADVHLLSGGVRRKVERKANKIASCAFELLQSKWDFDNAAARSFQHPAVANGQQLRSRFRF